MGRGQLFRVLIAATLAGILVLPACRHAMPPSGPADRPPSTSYAGLLVLNDADKDYANPPFEDVVHVLDAQGRQIRTLTSLNICQTVGASRAISISAAGETFVVCENVAHRLSAYQTRTGTKIWSLPGWFDTAVTADGSTYALVSTPTPSSLSPIYSNGFMIVDGTGTIIKQTQVRATDIAVDLAHRVLWLVGANIKKCTLDLEVSTTVGPTSGYAVSVDVRGDGAVWVAERAQPYLQANRNRLLRLSPEGVLQQEIPLKNLSPLCVRVDKSDGSVWMTGLLLRKGVAWSNLLRWPPRWITVDKPAGFRTRKYSAQGKLLVNIKCGGKAWDLDRSDGSVWVADPDGSRLRHYARDGKKLGTSDRLPAGDKWIAVVPRKP